MNKLKRSFGKVSLTLFMILALSDNILSEEVVSGTNPTTGEASHIRINQYYVDGTSAQNACSERAASLGWLIICHGPHQQVGGELFYQTGWLSSGGPGSNSSPFYLLDFYFNVTCSNGLPVNEITGCANPNRKQQCLSDKPVNIATGSKFFQITDYQHSDNPLLHLTRSYNSSDGKWVFNFSSRVFMQAARMRVIEDSGRSVTFRKENGVWVSEGGGNYGLVLDNGLWVFTNGRITKSFDNQSRLVSVTPYQGRTLAISYPSPGRAILQSGAASISISYQTYLSHVLSATLPGGQLINYVYDVQERLVQVDNRGQTEDYRYDDPSFPNAITSIIGADGNTRKEITYRADGRVQTSALSNGVDVDTFAYPQENVTSVTSSLGKETIYSFEEFWGEKKISSVQGVATANCVGANKNYTYYPSGMLKTKTDWKNNTTSYQYNTRNLESSRTEAFGTPQERIITTEWHPTFNLRTKVKEPGRETNFIYDAQGRLLSQTSSESPLN